MPDRIADQRKNFILDCTAVPFFDSTAANVIEGAAHKAQRAGVRFIISGASPQIRRTLINHGVKRPLVTYAASIKDARAQLAGKSAGMVAVPVDRQAIAAGSSDQG